MTSTRRFFAAASLVALPCLLLTACGGEEAEPPAPTSTALLYEGFRLITGEDNAPIDNAAFLVDEGVIMAVGHTGELGLPPGAERVDLSDQVVMPALVSLHGHLGFLEDLSFDAENYTRENIIDHLNRYAYYGVGTIVSLGVDNGDLAFDIRAEQEQGQLGGARLRTVGRGIADPSGGPGASTMRPAAYGATTEDEARQQVRELAEREVDAIKIWVDARGGSVEKFPIELSQAVIDEAHLRDLQVVAHIYDAADAAMLVDAGVDGFAHLARDEEMSSELVAAIARRDVFVMPNLAVAERAGYSEPQAFLDDFLLHESITPDIIARAKEAYTRRSAEGAAQAAATYATMEQSLVKLRDAGVRLVLGADSGITDSFFGYTELRELGLMVKAGMTPAEAIMAATRVPAAALGFDETGVLTAGKSADFIVLHADPLEDIANVKQIDRVFLKGAEVNRAALRAGWAGM